MTQEHHQPQAAPADEPHANEAQGNPIAYLDDYRRASVIGDPLLAPSQPGQTEPKSKLNAAQLLERASHILLSKIAEPGVEQASRDISKDIAKRHKSGKTEDEVYPASHRGYGSVTLPGDKTPAQRNVESTRNNPMVGVKQNLQKRDDIRRNWD